MLDFFFNYIEHFEGESVRPILVEHLEVPAFAVAMYLVLVLHVPDAYMKNRPPFNLQLLNIVWNFLLTVFACTGAYYTLPVLYKTIFVDHYEADLPGGGTEIRTGSFYDCICVWNPTLFYDGPAGAFVCFFILSKLPEMFDTVFLVFRKRPVVFLHWYHHITVMLFCWHAYTYMITSGLIFASMNYGVHSIMYFYYLMCALGYRKVVRPFAPLITFLQIAQMVVGTYVEIMSLYHIYFSGEGCASNTTNCRLGLMMYISYFALFTKLFKENYLTKKPASGKHQVSSGSGGAVAALDTMKETVTASGGAEGMPATLQAGRSTRGKANGRSSHPN